MSNSVWNVARNSCLSALVGLGLAWSVSALSPNAYGGPNASTGIGIMPPIDVELDGRPMPIFFQPGTHSYRIASLVPEVGAPNESWGSTSATYDDDGEGDITESLFTSVGGLDPGATYTLRVWRSDTGAAVDVGQFTTDDNGAADIFYSSDANMDNGDSGDNQGGDPGGGGVSPLNAGGPVKRATKLAASSLVGANDASNVTLQFHALNALSPDAEPMHMIFAGVRFIGPPINIDPPPGDNGGDPGNGGDGSGDPTDTGTIEISGTVSFLDIEGGFWILTTDDGTVYDLPADADEALLVDGQRAILDVNVLTDVVTIFMMGIPVEIVDIVAIGDEIDDGGDEWIEPEPPPLLPLPDSVRPVTQLNEVDIVDANGRLVMSGALVDEFFRPIFFAAMAGALDGARTEEVAVQNASAAADAVDQGRAELNPPKTLTELLAKQHVLDPVLKQAPPSPAFLGLPRMFQVFGQIKTLPLYADGRYIGDALVAKNGTVSLVKKVRGKLRRVQQPALDNVHTIDVKDQKHRQLLHRRIQN